MDVRRQPGAQISLTVITDDDELWRLRLERDQALQDVIPVLLGQRPYVYVTQDGVGIGVTRIWNSNIQLVRMLDRAHGAELTAAVTCTPEQAAHLADLIATHAKLPPLGAGEQARTKAVGIGFA